MLKNKKIKKLMITRPEVEVSVVGIKGFVIFLKALSKVYICKQICWMINSRQIAKTHVLVIPKIHTKFVKKIEEDGENEKY